MKILVAVPDRDLLSGLRKYFELCGHVVKTAFDGVKAVDRIRNDTFDAAVVDASLPRVPLKKVISYLLDADIHTTVLTEMRITAKTLTTAPVANSYLVYPFLPEEIFSRIETAGKADGVTSEFTLGGVEVSLSRRTIGDFFGFTDEEARILRDLFEGKTIRDTVPYGYIEAIGLKLRSQRAECRIEYFAGEGYRVVMKDE